MMLPIWIQPLKPGIVIPVWQSQIPTGTSLRTVYKQIPTANPHPIPLQCKAKGQDFSSVTDIAP
jgi:hypothetical protein